MQESHTKLFLVPTPIGNLEDITLRAIRVLQEVDLILCEDTRHTGKLLKHLSIENKLESFHAHNEHKKLDSIIERILSGAVCALVTDAGTPAISDPGFLLVRSCINQNLAVESLPGATAFVPALTKSGIPCDRFVFEGFLPAKKGRQTALLRMLEESRTCVFYESPHKLLKTFDQLEELGIEPVRQISVSRELTKLHEETITGKFIDVKSQLEEKPSIKGEFVIVLAGKDE